MSISISFYLLDQHDPNTCAVEFFDKLHLVERCDTGEIGYLLASDSCCWPEELIDQATWLEGCHTPPEYKDDPRLLTGYHPYSAVKWKVFNKDGRIKVRLRLINAIPELDEINSSIAELSNLVTDFEVPEPAESVDVPYDDLDRSIRNLDHQALLEELDPEILAELDREILALRRNLES